MRSRYTAFAVGDAAHLSRSWHPRTRPDDIDVDDGTTWAGLSIVAVDEREDSAEVEFRADWVREAQRGRLHERSRFLRRGGRWVYIDGDLE